MTAFNLFDYLDSDASPRFGAWTVGVALALTTGWFGLITSEQKSFYDPLCGSVSAAAADRYAECMTERFSGRGASATADMEMALAHMEGRFTHEDPLEDGGVILEHKGALLAAGKAPSRLFVGVEDDALVLRALKSDS